MSRLPYFSQFASRNLVNVFLSDPSSTRTDPRWAETGWPSREEYAYWAWNTCGVACIRSVLVGTGHEPTPAALAKGLLQYGAYSMSTQGRELRGLFYAPSVTYLKDCWGLDAEVLPRLLPSRLQDVCHRDRVFIASVTPAIRGLSIGQALGSATPGGHLVLVTDVTDDQVTFHNPSGLWPSGQADVVLPRAVFTAAFARRGISIALNTDSPHMS